MQKQSNIPEHILLFNLSILYLFFSYMLINAHGGIDLLQYKNISTTNISAWNAYHFKEIFSWSLIKLSFQISTFLNLKHPCFILSLILLTIFKLSIKKMDTSSKLIPLAMLSPFTVLLSLNILRQYIATVMVTLTIIHLFKNNFKLATVFSIFAIFSHQSVMFF